ncbi:MAG: Spo0B domain-containing protein [Bacillota bacterium]
MSDELTRALALLRSQRHSFLNHLQVISGWLQLGKSERAAQYIARAVALLEAESRALRRIDSPEVALFLMEMGIEAEPYGVTLRWRVDGAVDPALLPAARRQVKEALEQAARLPEGGRSLTIRLGSAITVHTPPASGKG